MQKKLNLNKYSIKNQQRFPISKFGWPLKEASELILKGEEDWEIKAVETIEKHINKRGKMVYLSEIYDLNSLKKWRINSAFIPWFSQKPQLNRKINDKDFLNYDAKAIVKKLCQLIKSIEKNGFINNPKLEDNIIVYPIDTKKKCYYVRAGNHRVAILSAMKKNIPCYLDNVSYLKSRDKLLISKYFWKFNTGKIYNNYPELNSFQNWPAVKSGIISEEDAISIKKLFCH